MPRAAEALPISWPQPDACRVPASPAVRALEDARGVALRVQGSRSARVDRERVCLAVHPCQDIQAAPRRRTVGGLEQTISPGPRVERLRPLRVQREREDATRLEALVRGVPALATIGALVDASRVIGPGSYVDRVGGSWVDEKYSSGVDDEVSGP
jgi:hypothetical protein